MGQWSSCELIGRAGFLGATGCANKNHPSGWWFLIGSTWWMVAEGTWELGIWASDIWFERRWAQVGFFQPYKAGWRNQWDHSETTMRLNRPLKADSMQLIVLVLTKVHQKCATSLISVATIAYPAHSLGFRPNPKPCRPLPYPKIHPTER